MRFLLVLWMVLACLFKANASALVAAPPKESPQAKTLRLQLDTGRVDVRKFDDEAIERYSKQKDFIYDDVQPKSMSWWDRFWRWVRHVIERIFSGGGKSASGLANFFYVFLKWAIVAVAVLAIAFIVTKILGLDLSILKRKSKTIDVPYEESLENIHEINFDEEIANALDNLNYRFAVRLLYLKTLKLLSDMEMIKWQREKTNQNYVAELEETGLQPPFAELTKHFEYIWYGEFFIDNEIFTRVNESFVQFNQQLK